MNKETYPILPLRDIVVYPKMIVPLFVGREKSIKALQQAIDNDQNIVLAPRRKPRSKTRSRRISLRSARWARWYSWCGCPTAR